LVLLLIKLNGTFSLQFKSKEFDINAKAFKSQTGLNAAIYILSFQKKDFNTKISAVNVEDEMINFRPQYQE